MREDELFAEAAEQHLAPAAPSFFEAFWREAEQRQRRAARRWRAAALALAVLTTAAVSAAGVMASSHAVPQAVVNRTIECTPSRFATGPQIRARTSVQTRQSDAYFHLTVAPPLEAIELGPPAVHFDQSSSTVTFDTHQCRVVHDQPVFAAHALVADNVYTPTFFGRFAAECTTAAKILIRTHVVFSRGKPVSAKIVVVDAATGRPRLYVDWSPTRIADWLDKRCYKGGY